MATRLRVAEVVGEGVAGDAVRVTEEALAVPDRRLSVRVAEGEALRGD